MPRRRCMTQGLPPPRVGAQPHGEARSQGRLVPEPPRGPSGLLVSRPPAGGAALLPEDAGAGAPRRPASTRGLCGQARPHQALVNVLVTLNHADRRVMLPEAAPGRGRVLTSWPMAPTPRLVDRTKPLLRTRQSAGRRRTRVKRPARCPPSQPEGSLRGSLPALASAL